MPCLPSIPEELENFAVSHCIEADWMNDPTIPGHAFPI